MSQISPAFFTQQLPKVGPVLRTLTADLTPEQARNWRDGPDGWNAIEVIAHLRRFRAHLHRMGAAHAGRRTAHPTPL